MRGEELTPFVPRRAQDSNVEVERSEPPLAKAGQPAIPVRSPNPNKKAREKQRKSLDGALGDRKSVV